jgi:hypothetical protein
MLAANLNGIFKSRRGHKRHPRTFALQQRICAYGGSV